MKIWIKQSQAEEMIAYARSQLPEEACGLLAGREDAEGRWIEEVYFLTNTDHSREHFSLDAREQLQAVRRMRSQGLLPLGNWHSHPESPSRPSAEDIRLAYDPRATYLILSLMEEEPVLRGFHIEDGQVRIEEMIFY